MIGPLALGEAQLVPPTSAEYVLRLSLLAAPTLIASPGFSRFRRATARLSLNTYLLFYDLSTIWSDGFFVKSILFMFDCLQTKGTSFMKNSKQPPNLISRNF